jgi:DNA replication protein DnaC
LLKRARLKYPQACIEDVNTSARRGLDHGAFTSLALSRWVEQGLTVNLIGPTGSGKSWLACALAQHACRRQHSALYLRVPRLAEELRILHGNGGFPTWLAALARTEVLILDDWALAPIEPALRADLLEIIDDRAGNRACATILTTQLPVDHWHAWLGDPTIADAILDRLLSREHRINLKGRSLRDNDTRTAQTEATDPEN